MNWLVAFALLGISDVEQPTITPDDDPTRVVVGCVLPADAAAALQSAVSPKGNLDEQAGRRVLGFALVDAETGQLGPPVFGRYELHNGRLLFRPRFGLVRGSRYRAVLYVEDSEQGRIVASTAEYVVPPHEQATPTTVVSVFPSGDRFPANVLKFYLTFSRPMREGREVHERIRLFDSAGKEIGAPWRDIELWNDDATRLVLFIHPGRIKQGVNLREQLGPVLEPGETYTLVVGGDLRDARGAPLGRDYRKTFTTTAEVRRTIDVAAWRLAPPQAGTREPLGVRFDVRCDRYLAARCIHVRDAEGNEVPGLGETAGDETGWSFTPRDPWPNAPLQLTVDAYLEDLCGNTPERAFDHDLESARPGFKPVLSREFSPR